MFLPGRAAALFHGPLEGVTLGRGQQCARRPNSFRRSTLQPLPPSGRVGFLSRGFHIGADLGSNLIRRMVLTPGNVNESSVADDLICGDEQAVYGDKGYENKKRRRRLRRAGIKDRICHRSHKHQKGLPRWQRRRNAGIAKRRAPRETIFGTIKRGFGWVRARYTRFAGNVADAFRIATAFNLRRAASLLAQAEEEFRPKPRIIPRVMGSDRRLTIRACFAEPRIKSAIAAQEDPR